MATHPEFRAWHSKARQARKHNTHISIGQFCGYRIAAGAKPQSVGSFHGYSLPYLDRDPLLQVAAYRESAAEFVRFQRGKSHPVHRPYRGEYDLRHARAYRPCAGMARLRMIESAIRMDIAQREALAAWRAAA